MPGGSGITCNGRNCLAGKIILSLAQTPCGDNHVGAAQGHLKSIGNHFGIITNGDFSSKVDIDFAQTARNVGGIRIEDVANEEFGANLEYSQRLRKHFLDEI